MTACNSYYSAICALFRNSVILAVILFFLKSGDSYAQTPVSKYKVYLALGKYEGKDILVTRQFEQAGRLTYLSIDLNSMETMIIAGDRLDVNQVAWNHLFEHYQNTPYIRALQNAKERSLALQNAGITHGYSTQQGITLTIDLCPSHKPLDRRIFTSLISEFKKIEKPVPVALSITGRFMLTHTADIDWLKEMERSGEIQITWINHTYTHHYNPSAPVQKNFLLEAGTDLHFEITGTEIAMLQHDLLPSVFFRFPGLVSDPKLVDSIITYGLIPIGSDAWLAKGQQAHNGSIVLIHGNGNEPVGVNDFISLLRTKKDSVLNKQWLLYDLRESIDDEFRQ